MKLLFDENLSPVLPRRLSDCYGECRHVRDRSSLRGYPPKVIWIALGNCSTRTVEDLLRQRAAEVTEFLADEVKAFLVLS